MMNRKLAWKLFLLLGVAAVLYLSSVYSFSRGVEKCNLNNLNAMLLDLDGELKVWELVVSDDQKVEDAKTQLQRIIGTKIIVYVASDPDIKEVRLQGLRSLERIISRYKDGSFKTGDVASKEALNVLVSHEDRIKLRINEIDKSFAKGLKER